jgi:threonine dehydrogenase-like Zn-dependent dehydrogenase
VGRGDHQRAAQRGHRLAVAARLKSGHGRLGPLHIDPTFVITHRLSLAEAAQGYKHFGDRADGWIKVVLKP